MEIPWEAVYILLFAIFGLSTEAGGNKPPIRSFLGVYTTLHEQTLITLANSALDQCLSYQELSLYDNFSVL